MFAEYSLCAIFIVLFSGLVFGLTSKVGDHYKFDIGGLTTVSFAVGAFTSLFAGYVGMYVATFANARCTIAASQTGAAVCS